MTSISIRSIAAASEIASFIAAPKHFSREDAEGRLLRLTLSEPVEAQAVIAPGRDYTEIRFHKADGSSVGANITIERPESARWGREGVEPANVSWSSSSTSGDLADAIVTAKVLGVAAQVAAILNRWAADGQLDYLKDEVAS